MNRMTRPSLALALALWAIPGLATADKSLSDRISIDLEKAKLEEVLKHFWGILQVEVVIEPGVEGEITLTLHNVTVRTVLDALCESGGCAWQLEDDPRVLRFSPAADKPGPRGEMPGLEKKIDMSLVDAPAETVLTSMAKILEAALELNLDVADAKVTIEASNQTVRQSLDHLCAQLACRWELTAEEPRTLSVDPAGNG